MSAICFDTSFQTRNHRIDSAPQVTDPNRLKPLLIDDVKSPN